MGKEDIEEVDQNELQNQRIEIGFIYSPIFKLLPLVFYIHNQKPSNVSSKFIHKHNFCRLYYIFIALARLLFDGINSRNEMLIE